VWLREEYPEPQRNTGGDIYFSYVEKSSMTVRMSGARVLIIYYSENNITGSETSEATDVKQAAW